MRRNRCRIAGCLLTLAVLGGGAWADDDVSRVASWKPLDASPAAVETGDPAAVRLGEGRSRWVAGADGSLAVATGPGKGPRPGAVVADGEPLRDGEEVVFRLRKYETQGDGWKSLQLGLATASGAMVVVNLGADRGGVWSFSGKEGKNLGGGFSHASPEEIRIRRTGGELLFFREAGGAAPFFRCADVPAAPYGRPVATAGVKGEGDALAALLDPVQIRSTPASASAATPAGPPAPPPAAEFPKMVMATAMMWSLPYSPRFVPNGAKVAPDAGYYENAPLIPRQDDGTDLKAPLPYRAYQDAKAGGIDAIVVDMFDSEPGRVVRWAGDSRRSGANLQVLPMVELTHMHKERDAIEFFADYGSDPGVRADPNVVRFGDCPVVLTYGTLSVADWKSRLEPMRKAGGRCFIIGDTTSAEIATSTQVPREKLQDGLALLDGLYFFHTYAALSPQGTGILPDFLKFGRSFSPPKVVGASVAPGYISSARVGNLFDPRGTFQFRHDWLNAIRYNPDFVHYTTLNDYSETEMECSGNSTFSFLDLNAYFAARWKSGKWPALDKPEAFLSYRKAVSVNEPVECELVLLRPELAGDEEPGAVARRFQAAVVLQLSGGTKVELDAVPPEVFPGHLCWRFWSKGGLGRDGYAIPVAALSVDGKPVSLPDGPCPAFAVVKNGEPIARKWLNVPLHRIRDGVHARVVVAGSPGNGYPRTVRIEGLPWEQVAGGLLERGANPLSTTLPAKTLRDGFLEDFFPGIGWMPMRYADGWIRRCLVDQADRYTGVVRMKDDTFVYPSPVVIDPPKPDPATVFDPIISPNGDLLVDRGPLRRDMPLDQADDAKARPAVAQDRPGSPWFLRFDGKTTRLATGPFSMPPGPGTLEVWLRPHQVGRTQTILDSWGSALNLDLDASGVFDVLRVDQKRKSVVVTGSARAKASQWVHVTAVFTGAELQLYVNGQPDGRPVPTNGLRTDEKTVIGYGAGIMANLAGNHNAGYLDADIARLRVLQRSFSADEVRESYLSTREDFNPAP